MEHVVLDMGQVQELFVLLFPWNGFFIDAGYRPRWTGRTCMVSFGIIIDQTGSLYAVGSWEDH